MSEEKIHFGYIESKPDARDFFLGGGNLPHTVLEEKGDWSDALPVTETQVKGLIDTINCTGFATTNQIEMYEYKAFGERNNYSDRWVALISGTTKFGNDPTTVYEAIRTYGLIPEEMLPWDDTIQSIDDYLSWKGADKEACYRKGREWLSTHTFLHQWVFDKTQPLDEKMNNMKVALKFSPLALGVYAWATDSQGMYIRQGNDCHWTTCYAIDNNEFIFDSYSPFQKVLTPDFNFFYAKRISIEKVTPAVPKPNWVLDLLSQLLQALKDLLTLDKQMIQTTPTLPATPANNAPVVPIEVPKPSLADVAKQWIGKDASPLNKAPQALACAEGASNILHEYNPAFPAEILSTDELFKVLKTCGLFTMSLNPLPNCVIISPTIGSATGHTGFIIENQRIVSNDSATGLMQNNYNFVNWISYFKGKGLHTFIFVPKVA